MGYRCSWISVLICAECRLYRQCVHTRLCFVLWHPVWLLRTHTCQTRGGTWGPKAGMLDAIALQQSRVRRIRDELDLLLDLSRIPMHEWTHSRIHARTRTYMCEHVMCMRGSGMGMVECIACAWHVAGVTCCRCAGVSFIDLSTRSRSTACGWGFEHARHVQCVRVRAHICIRPFVHSSVRPPVPSVRRSVRPVVRLCVRWIDRPSVRPPARPPVRPSVHPSARPPACPSVCASARAPVRTSIRSLVPAIRSPILALPPCHTAVGSPMARGHRWFSAIPGCQPVS